MIVDASALCAIALREREREPFLTTLSQTRGAQLSPLQVWETCVSVSSRLGGDRSEEVYELIGELGIEVAMVGVDESKLAFEAWRRFGKGRHPAGLNLGDCFAYALAKSRGLPLLYKGDDFSQTDVRSALR